MLCGLNGASDNSYVKVLALAAVKAQQDWDKAENQHDKFYFDQLLLSPHI